MPEMSVPEGWGGLFPVECMDCGWTTLITPNPEAVQRHLVETVIADHGRRCPGKHHTE